MKQLNLRLTLAALIAFTLFFGALAASAVAQSRSRPLLHPPFKTAQKAIFKIGRAHV